MSFSRLLRCKEIATNDESLTAEPQNERSSSRMLGHPKHKTSIAISERAQQKFKSRISKLVAELAMEIIDLSVRKVQSFNDNFFKFGNDL